jgi:hypothetical protein
MTRLWACLILCVGLLAASAWADVPQLINYQGKLTSKSGAPITAVKGMVFEFYDAAAGGQLLGGFSETQNVAVTNGLFQVLIGSATVNGVPRSIFNSPAVYLSVKVAGEELTPRQQIVSVAYAFKAAEAEHAAAADSAATAANADTLDSLDSTAFARTAHQHVFRDLTGTATDAQIPDDITISRAATAGDASTLDGLDASDFARASHAHSGEQITSGVVADARIDPAIARDSELASALAAKANTVHQHDFADLADSASDAQIPDNITINHAATAGDASTLNSLDSAAFARSVHQHDFADLTDSASDEQIPDGIARDAEIMPAVLAADGAGSTLDADLLDGKHAAAFMLATADNWVNTTGDTMTGALILPSNGLAVGTNELVVASSRVGIGTAAPSEKLEVAGTVRATGLKLPTNASNGYVLTSDSNGVGTWQPATTGPHNHFGETWSGSGPDGLRIIDSAQGCRTFSAHASAPTGLSQAGYFQTSSSSGTGVYGFASALDASMGRTYGLYGYAAATVGPACGAYGQSDSFDGVGVTGYATAPQGLTFGVYGEAVSLSGYGIYTPNRMYSGDQIVSGVGAGRPPLVVSSNTVVPNFNADLLDGWHGASFRNASNISGGMLSTDYYSAYSDLTAEGYLDNNSDGDLLTRGQADGRYVNEGQAGAITANMIAAGAVGSAAIADDSITQADLASGSVGAWELADDAVDTAAIQDGAVTSVKLADGAALAEILDDDGTGSGLDADLLDGTHATGFWKTTGNSGTGAANYVGTTDTVDLIFKTNGAERVRVTSGGDLKVTGKILPDGGIVTATGITIRSISSNIQIIAGSSTITVDPTGGVTIQGSKVQVTSSGDLNLRGDKVNITSDHDMTLTSGTTLSATAGGNATIKSNTTLKLEATGQNVWLKAAGNVDVDAAATLDIDAGNIDMDAGGMIDIDGAIITLN